MRGLQGGSVIRRWPIFSQNKNEGGKSQKKLKIRGILLIHREFKRAQGKGSKIKVKDGVRKENAESMKKQ